VARRAIEVAHPALADRRVFVVDQEAWSELQALLRESPTTPPGLAELLAAPSLLKPRDG
jgi:uncharacterized protein (DUF1778 family)